MAEHGPLKLDVVSAERMLWEGEVVNIIARTVEGDIGILPGHEPLMAVLVPSVVDIVTNDGRSETLAVDGGFLSVAHGHVRILSSTALLGTEVTLDDAYREMADLQTLNQKGQLTDAQTRRLHILRAQIRAGEKAQQRTA